MDANPSELPPPTSLHEASARTDRPRPRQARPPGRLRSRARCFGFVGGLIAGVSGCGNSVDLPPAVEVWAEALECAPVVADRLVRWRISGEILGAPPSPNGTVTRFSTDSLGVWVEVVETGAGETLVTRLSAHGSEGIRVDGQCNAGTVVRGPAPVTDPRAGFTDEELARELGRATREGQSGVVIYVWSPHMPLSVDGWGPLVEAADDADLRAVPVLLANGDTDFAAREAARVGLPDEALRPLASVELLMRDAQLHAPSVIVFEHGRASPVLPGYRDRDGYVDFIERFRVWSSSGAGSRIPRGRP